MAVPLNVGAKGRIVLPIKIRDAANIAVGDEVIVRAIGDRQVLIEGREAVIGRLRTRFAAGGGRSKLEEMRAAERQAQRARTTARVGQASTIAPRDLAAELRRAEEILRALDV